MDGYLLDTNHFIPLLREKDDRRTKILTELAAVSESPVCVATATIAELEVGCCLGKMHERSEAQSELREVIKANKLRVLEFTNHTAAEYGALKAALMQKYNREGLKRAAKWPERWPNPDTGGALEIDEFDLLVVSHAVERKLVLVTTDSMRRIMDGIVWPGDCPEPISWISENEK
jgi:predicted nucleic acid-binding protein